MKHTFPTGTGLLASQHTPEEMKEAMALIISSGQDTTPGFLEYNPERITVNLCVREGGIWWLLYGDITLPITLSELKEMLKPKKDCPICLGTQYPEKDSSKKEFGVCYNCDQNGKVPHEKLYTKKDLEATWSAALDYTTDPKALNFDQWIESLTAENGVNKKGE